jgi:hypothetical protein
LSWLRRTTTCRSQTWFPKQNCAPGDSLCLGLSQRRFETSRRLRRTGCAESSGRHRHRAGEQLDAIASCCWSILNPWLHLCGPQDRTDFVRQNGIYFPLPKRIRTAGQDGQGSIRARPLSIHGSVFVSWEAAIKLSDALGVRWIGKSHDCGKGQRLNDPA